MIGIFTSSILAKVSSEKVKTMKPKDIPLGTGALGMAKKKIQSRKKTKQDGMSAAIEQRQHELLRDVATCFPDKAVKVLGKERYESLLKESSEILADCDRS